jgi:splicing factor 3B subunit 3
MCALDYDTVAGGDKFGSLFVLELPGKTSDEVNNPTGSRILWDQGLLNGAPTKVDLKSHYYLGEAITGMVKAALMPGCKEALIVGTIMGGIYAFVPFSSKEDISFFQHLEMFMRQEWPNLCQRDHLSYRSYYQPVKDVIDGDLCERYGSMPYSKQKEIADDLNRSPSELMKKLEDTRNALL